MSPSIKTVKGNISEFVASNLGPRYDRIELGEADKEFWPELFAHEDAHRRLGHRDVKEDWEYPVEVFNDEIAAWDLALSRRPTGDFRKSIVMSTLDSYLQMVAFQFGNRSRKYLKCLAKRKLLLDKYFKPNTKRGLHKIATPQTRFGKSTRLSIMTGTKS